MALLTGRAVLDRHGDLLELAPGPPGEPPHGEPGADRQVPSAAVKTPAAPGRTQLPAAIGF